MPLTKGSSQETVNKNIAELMKTEHPKKQAIAIAIELSKKGKKKNV